MERREIDMLPIHQVLLAVICLVATLLSSSCCNALTTVHQCSGRRRIRNVRGGRLEVLSSKHTTLFLANHSRLFDVEYSNRVEEIPTRISKHLSHRIHPIYSLRDIADDRDDLKHNDRANYNLMHSIALIATCRRISFLACSIILVNFIRNTILKIPKSNKQGMFDECPWPFTLFHDPIKFIKTGATHVVIVWAITCQLYAQYMKVKAIIP